MQALPPPTPNLCCGEPRPRGSAPVLLDGHGGSRRRREAKRGMTGNVPARNRQRDASEEHQASHLKHGVIARLTDERHVDVELCAQRAQKYDRYKEGIWQHKGTT